MVNEIRRGGLNEIRRGVEMPLWGAESRQAGHTCECGRTFSTAQQIHECPCGITWVSRQAYEQAMRERRSQEARTVTTTTTTTTPRKAYTMADAKAQAVAERDACWSVIERKAAEIQGPRKLTKEAAISTVLNENRGLYKRYRELDNIDYQAEQTLGAMAMTEATAEAETLGIVDAMRKDNRTDLEKRVDALAAPIATEHAISLEQAREHVLRRNPELQVEWLNALVNGLPGDDPTMSMSERKQRLETELEARAKLIAATEKGTTYAQAYTRLAFDTPEFRRRLVEVRRG